MHGQGCTWIVTADGGAARVFEERRRGVTLAERAAFNQEAHDLIEPRDRPPRVQESVGPRRHGMEHGAPPHEDAERRFLKRVAAHLNEAAAGGLFEFLVLFAAPRALGVLRNALSAEALRRIDGEGAMDVVREGAAEIQARLDRLRHGG